MIPAFTVRFVRSFVPILFVAMWGLPTPAAAQSSAVDSLLGLADDASGADRARHLVAAAQALGSTDFLEAVSIARQAARIAAQEGDSALVGRALREAGINLYFQGDFEEAQITYLRGFEAAGSAGDGAGQALILNELGTLYKRQGDLDRSLQYFEDALEISEAVMDTVQIANSMNNMGIVHDVRGEYEEAMRLFTLSAELKESAGDLNGLTYNLDNMGMVTARLGRYAEAEAYFRRAASIRQQLGDLRGYGIILNNMGEMYALRNRWPQARAHYQDALAIARQTGYSDFERHVLGMISATYEEEGDYASALDFFRQQTALSDSLFNAERSRQLIEMREQFDSERKEQTIALQESQLAQKSAALQRNYLLLGLVLVLLLALGLTLVWQRTKHEMNMREVQTAASIDSQERERKRIAQDLHDGLGQMIATARLAAGKEESSPVAEDVDRESILDEMYSELRNVAFNLMPAALTRGGAVQAIEELASRINQAGKIKISVSSTGARDGLKEAEHVAVYRIVQEWLSNIIKHGHASRVEVQFVRHDDEWVVMVEDDGEGFNTRLLEQGSGNGWMNIQTRARRVQGLVHVDSQVGGHGTTFIVRIPRQEAGLLEELEAGA